MGAETVFTGLGEMEARRGSGGGVFEFLLLGLCALGCTAFANADSESGLGLNQVLIASWGMSFEEACPASFWKAGDEPSRPMRDDVVETTSGGVFQIVGGDNSWGKTSAKASISSTKSEVLG